MTFFCSDSNRPTVFYLHRWDSVVVQVLSIVGQQVSSHPGYSIVTTGHSLGGSLALLAAVTLQQTFADRYETMNAYKRHGNPLSSGKLGHTLTVLPVPE